MKLKRTPQAIIGFRGVSLYIIESFGETALREFRQRTREVEKLIMQMPNIGTIEWEDVKEGVAYRSMTIYRRSKLLYFVKDDTIYVADFWDVRQDKH